MYHIPVLLKESIEGLNINPEGLYVDVTFGSGGHSRKILEHLTTGRLFAFDQDPDASRNLVDDERFRLIGQNFRFLKNFLKFNGVSKIDGILADLGISSWQIDQAARGFSTRGDGPLDMRMNPASGTTALELIRDYPAEMLAKIFRDFGEIENASRLAASIVEARQVKPVETTGELKHIILPHARRGKENQYLARVFQAIRIEVNEELDALKDLLTAATDLLHPGGRIVVISYHSLEDRLIKNYFRAGNFEGKEEKDFYGNVIAPLRPLNRKAIIPSAGEELENPRSRSAKLRIAEKK